MGKIDLTIHKEGLAHNIQKAKENNIIIPTIAQMQNPDLIPEKIKEKLTHTGLWDVDGDDGPATTGIPTALAVH